MEPGASDLYYFTSSVQPSDRVVEVMDATGTVYKVGRVIREGTIIPAKIHPSGRAYFARFGSEYSIEEYETLVVGFTI